MGAAALVTDRDVMSRLQAYVNVESIGSAGDPTLFETGPGNGWLVTPWARQAPRPRGGSFGLEIYRRLPNDTDFSILKRQGVPGLNFAIVGDSYAYHTTRDTPERLSPVDRATHGRTSRRPHDRARRRGCHRADGHGSNVLRPWRQSRGVVWARHRGGDRRRRTAPWHHRVAARDAHGDQARRRVAMAAHGVLDARRLGCGHRVDGGRHLGATPGARGLSPLVRAARAIVPAPDGRGHHRRLEQSRASVTGCRPGRTVCGTRLSRGAWPCRCGSRSARAPRFLAPGAAYLWLLPLLCAGLLLSIIPLASAVAVRAASALVLLVAAALWLLPTEGAAPLHGRHLRAAAGCDARVRLRGTPDGGRSDARATPRRDDHQDAGVRTAVARDLDWTLRHRHHRRPRLRGACAIRTKNRFGGPRAPCRRATVRRSGTWVRSSRASISAKRAPPGWLPASTAPPATVPFRRFPHPFVFRTTGPSLGPAPITIASLDRRAGRGRQRAGRDRHAAPAGPWRWRSCCPSGLEPARSNLPGVVRLGRWTATYRAPTPEGLVFRASFGRNRRRPAARPSRHRDRGGPRRRLRLAAAGVAAGTRAPPGRRSVLDRGAVRAADCARSAATLDYVAVTVFGVIARASLAPWPTTIPSSTGRSFRPRPSSTARSSSTGSAATSMPGRRSSSSRRAATASRRSSARP